VVRVSLIAVVYALAAGCQTSSFVCQTDVQCGAMGTCEANGSCSFPDDTCDSGRRYGAHAADPDVCVPVEESATDEPESSTTTMPSTSSGPPVTSDDDSTTMAVSLSDATSVTTSESTSSSTDKTTDSSSSTGEPMAPYDFEDDFERRDAEDVSNGWIEKTPDAFSLVNGGLRRTTGMTSYPDNLVYRPDEEWLDAEAVLSLTWDMVEPWGFPQFTLRAQLDDIAMAGSLTGYLLFVEDEGVLMITRQIAGEFTLEEIVELTGPIVVGVPYRMRMRVTGTDPVQVDGYLEEFGAAGWVVHTEAHLTDASEMRITTPGTLALGAHVTLEAWTYEHIGLYVLD
jgi:hypothetical protein